MFERVITLFEKLHQIKKLYFMLQLVKTIVLISILLLIITLTQKLSMVLLYIVMVEITLLLGVIFVIIQIIKNIIDNNNMFTRGESYRNPVELIYLEIFLELKYIWTVGLTRMEDEEEILLEFNENELTINYYGNILYIKSLKSYDDFRYHIVGSNMIYILADEDRPFVPIKSKVINPHKKPVNNNECIFCCEIIKEKIFVMSECQCTAVFHEECITQWLISHNQCPMCRNRGEIIAEIVVEKKN